jgi:degradative hydroxymethylglutaryl-CoA reductase
MKLISIGNQCCSSMVSRGGGIIDLETRVVPKSKKTPGCSNWLVVHVHIDVCEAMGANCASMVAEELAPHLAALCNCRSGFRIVSNLSPQRLTKSTFRLPVSSLAYKGHSGQVVAERICEANDWAMDDPFRAVTHNKGIMNGIDAVAVATGQDWRAIESACHSWGPYQNSKLRPFTSYHVETVLGVPYLVGSLELPLLVASKGGALMSNPLYRYTMGLLNNPDSKQLAMVLI